MTCHGDRVKAEEEEVRAVCTNASSCKGYQEALKRGPSSAGNQRTASSYVRAADGEWGTHAIEKVERRPYIDIGGKIPQETPGSDPWFGDDNEMAPSSG